MPEMGAHSHLFACAAKQFSSVPLVLQEAQRKRFVWQGLRMIQEVRESSVSSYVYSPEAEYTPLARLDVSIIAADVIENAKNSTRVYHFHTDLVGAPLEVTDEAGELAWAGKYRAWGKVEGGEDQALLARIEQPLRLPGQYEDESTGLHYNTFRFYDPDIGRFISQDPIGLDGGANLYAYTPNPTGWMDPWGWCATALGKNMEAAGIHRPANTTPHHIGGDTSIRSLPARNILKAHGIHHDDALNGVFLPNRFNTDLSIPGILHNGRHPDKYIDAVNDRLRTANARGGKQAVEMELGQLRQELLNAVRTAKWSTVI
ncbi:hypothetical protein F1735_32430 [Massilia sp. CCM 8694]|uniref:RHS protein conserved region domain-containing protein n=1 Tax=Massilia genomosp. 1 TaxID=2609280 RepID=A0ABX0MW08_9BURK|nr:hypothetical protein [Massilia genomosp. 1]